MQEMLKKKRIIDIDIHTDAILQKMLSMLHDTLIRCALTKKKALILMGMVCKIIIHISLQINLENSSFLWILLEMLLPELEVDFLARSLLTRLLDIPGCYVGTAEVDSDFCPEGAFQAVHVGAVDDSVAHAT